MGSFGSGDRDEPISEINVTPFVDIILVVLIIFMVTTPIIMKPSLQIQLPKAASGDDSTASQLNIAISSSGEIELNGAKIEKDQLSAATTEIIGKNPEVQAIIAADQMTAHGVVVSVIDAVKTAGVRKFAISIDRK